MNKFRNFVLYNFMPLSAGFIIGSIKDSGVEAYLSDSLTDIAFPICLFGPTIGATLLSFVETPKKKENLEAKIKGAKENLEEIKDSISIEAYDLIIKKLEKKESKILKMSRSSNAVKSGIKTMALTSVGYFLGSMFAKLYI